MSTVRPLPQEALTLEQYRALDAAGRITRPITDPPIGGSHTAKERRKRDAHASAAWGDHHQPAPKEHTTSPQRPLYGPQSRENEPSAPIHRTAAKRRSQRILEPMKPTVERTDA